MADKKASSPRRVAPKVTNPVRSKLGIPQNDPLFTSQFRRIMTGKPGDSVVYGPEKYDADGLSPTSVRWSERQGRFVDAPAPSNEKVRAKLSQAGKARQARQFNTPATVGYRQGVRIPESARPPRRKVSGSSAYPPQRPIPGSISEFRRMSGTPQMRRAIGRGIGSMAAMMGAKAAGDYIASTPLGRAIRRSLVK